VRFGTVLVAAQNLSRPRRRPMVALSGRPVVTTGI
jgi:hypothetical protein